MSLKALPSTVPSSDGIPDFPGKLVPGVRTSGFVCRMVRTNNSLSDVVYGRVNIIWGIQSRNTNIFLPEEFGEFPPVSTSGGGGEGSAREPLLILMSTGRWSDVNKSKTVQSIGQ